MIKPTALVLVASLLSSSSSSPTAAALAADADYFSQPSRPLLAPSQLRRAAVVGELPEERKLPQMGPMCYLSDYPQISVECDELWCLGYQCCDDQGYCNQEAGMNCLKQGVFQIKYTNAAFCAWQYECCV